MTKKHKAASKSVSTGDLITKLSNVKSRMVNCTADENKLAALNARYHKNVKLITWLTAIYNVKFLASVSINTAIYSILSLILLDSRPPLDLFILIMFNFVVMASLFLSLAISSYILNKIESISSKVDIFCQEVDSLISSSR